VSLKQLEERTALRGRKISLSALSKIENGDRKVDVDDLLVIALALDTSPTALLLPIEGEPDDSVRVTGGYGSLALIWGWAVGAQSIDPRGNERAFKARSLPDWYIDDNGGGLVAELRTRKAETQLGMAPAGSEDLEPIVVIRTLDFDRREPTIVKYSALGLPGLEDPSGEELLDGLQPKGEAVVTLDFGEDLDDGQRH
jgi:transcriptional regulator with XRE-family HTH domain